jgi:hypothetical protein
LIPRGAAVVSHIRLILLKATGWALLAVWAGNAAAGEQRDAPFIS